VVNGFALSADAAHDIANRRRDAQRARIMVRREIGAALT
jgi:hypothetical protein